ncbi:Zn-ribbon domain-containing OB-fold protein [Variovorax paradoxus]|uniref:Zn-ribbon domain-containing OB-fold protein n=1 Tax=Variovorax paradoxus TaxID=34073 RepID=UPI003ECF3176
MDEYTNLPKPEMEFLGHLQNGKFFLQRSRSDKRFHFYPRCVSPVHGLPDLDWVEASGDGVIYTVTLVRPRAPAAPYNVVLVDLAEGPRIMSSVVDASIDEIQIGSKVKALIGFHNGENTVLFRLVR